MEAGVRLDSAAVGAQGPAARLEDRLQCIEVGEGAVEAETQPD